MPEEREFWLLALTIIYAITDAECDSDLHVDGSQGG